jgi:uncharacterized repeat protein (TIGR01451 family)
MGIYNKLKSILLANQKNWLKIFSGLPYMHENTLKIEEVSMRVSGRSESCSLTRMLGMWAGLLLIVPQLSWAISTPAGTIITNVATVNYSLGGSMYPPATSAPVSIKVDELIQPVLTWQDAAAVPAISPGTNAVLQFLLTNAGNGQEAFSLTRTNGPLPLPAGNYTPLNGTIGSIYLENGLQAGFQASGSNADTAYVPDSNDPNLAPGAGKVVYVISDTPVVPNGAKGEVKLAAASLTSGAAGAAPGTSLAGLGQGGGFAVVGATRAQASATGSYTAISLTMTVNKTVVSVVDPNGTAVLMPGTVMTYQIAVSLSGTGTATNLVIADPLPADTTYVPGSIIVDGITKTDTADADNAQFAANTVSVSLGNVAAPANIVITFRATIN